MDDYFNTSQSDIFFKAGFNPIDELETLDNEIKKDLSGGVGKYEVLISRYPDSFTVWATSEAEAIKQARENVKYSVWDVEASRIE